MGSLGSRGHHQQVKGQIVVTFANFRVFIQVYFHSCAAGAEGDESACIYIYNKIIYQSFESQKIATPTPPKLLELET